MSARVRFFAFALALAACSRPFDRARNDAGTHAIDGPTMAFLSMARARHHEANIREAQGDIPGAIGALDALIGAPRPADPPVPEVREVLADACARIAEFELARNRDTAALARLDEGLAFADAPTFFRGHLLELQGIAFELRANALADAGQRENASAARELALERLRQAISIQERVVRDRTLEAGP
jgi:hypothetical protein